MKKFSKLFIIDGSFLLHRCLKVESLWDLKNKNGDRTGGVFGFVRALNSEATKNDHFPVVTWDHGLADRRVKVYPYYKRHDERLIEELARKIIDKSITEEESAKRLNEEFSGEVPFDRVRDAINIMISQGHTTFRDPDDYLYQYHRQRGILINILEAFGIPSFRYKGWEGDDLMTLLSRISDHAIVLTDDKDLIQLIRPNIDINRPMQKEYLTYDEYLRDEGFASEREQIILKAISGDGSDNIPSVTSGLERKYCLGSTRGRTVAKIIYESGEDPEVYLPKLREMNKNYYNGFIMRHDDFLRNMKLVDLSLVTDPDMSITTDMISRIMRVRGTTNLMNAVKLLGELDITKIDTSSLVGKMNLASAALEYKEYDE